MELLNSSLGKLAVSLALLAAIAPVVVWFFRDTWVELEAEANAARNASGRPRLDARIPATFLLGGLSLLLINYYGNYDFFETNVLPSLERWSALHSDSLRLGIYKDLYWRVFWGLSRYVFYLLPIAVWPLAFKENPLDLGLRFRGFREHAWIYLLCLVIVIPTLVIVSYTPDFAHYYPMYKGASRSWLDFWVWEALYVGQFLVLEIFFRGFWLRGARTLGVGAIFSMLVPYAMIHFPKPYLEACGALVAGTVLGSLSMKTGSIWAGFLIHSTVAILMDLLALDRNNRLPTQLVPYAAPHYKFPFTSHLLWCIWLLAAVGLVVMLRRRRRRG